MSWKGFVKAVQRLPHQVLAKAGHAEETVDEEFNHLFAQFELLEDATTKLNDDASKFKRSVEAMFAHQTSFAQTLLEAYSPISGEITPADPEFDPAAAGEKTLKRVFTPPESIEAVQMYLRNLEATHTQVLPHLSIVERRVIQPATDLLATFKRIRKTITKRNHKLIDYDRHRSDVAKLRAAPTKDAKDERRLITMEQQLQQATHEFAVLNDALKQQLPTFLQLRLSFIDPCFQSLYALQLKIYLALLDVVEPLRTGAPQLDFAAPVVSRFEIRKQAVDDKVNALQILKFKPAALLAASASGTPATGNSPNPTRPHSLVGTPPMGPAAAAAVVVGANGIPTASTSAPPPKYSPSAIPTAMPVPTMAPSGKGAVPVPTAARWCTALYDFAGQQADDLPFKAGDRIEILESTASTNDWWKGRLNGKTGFFPANFVELS